MSSGCKRSMLNMNDGELEPEPETVSLSELPLRAEQEVKSQRTLLSETFVSVLFHRLSASLVVSRLLVLLEPVDILLEVGQLRCLCIHDIFRCFKTNRSPF